MVVHHQFYFDTRKTVKNQIVLEYIQDHLGEEFF